MYGMWFIYPLYLSRCFLSLLYVSAYMYVFFSGPDDDLDDHTLVHCSAQFYEYLFFRFDILHVVAGSQKKGY